MVRPGPRHPRLYTHGGKTQTLREWERDTGMSPELLRNRRKKPEPQTTEEKRAECVAGIRARMSEPGSMLTAEAALLAAWDAGYNAGVRT